MDHWFTVGRYIDTFKHHPAIKTFTHTFPQSYITDAINDPYNIRNWVREDIRELWNQKSTSVTKKPTSNYSHSTTHIKRKAPFTYGDKSRFRRVFKNARYKKKKLYRKKKW